MRHQVAGRKLKRTHSHRKALLHNLATQLFEHKKVHTTEAKAKELKSFAERLISKAKHALIKEKQGELPNGQTIDVHNRRQVGRIIRNKAVLQELFDSIAPAVESRNGGFTRVVKTGVRRGDSARTALIELVDFAAEQDGAISTKRKRKSTKKVETPQHTTPTNITKDKNLEVSNISDNVVNDEPAEVTAINESDNLVFESNTATEDTAAKDSLVFEDTTDDIALENNADNSDEKSEEENL